MVKYVHRQDSGLRKLVKEKEPHFLCLACAASTTEFETVCPHCGRIDTLTENDAEEDDAEEAPPRRHRAEPASAIAIAPRPFHSTGRKAWDLVLGGGFVRPSSVLIFGKSGVGKTTSLLRMAEYLGSTLRKPVLYGSAEMPKEHLCFLGRRLRLRMGFLYVNDSGHFEEMAEDIEELSPAVVIWDSIQRHRVEQELGEVEIRKIVCGAIDLGKAAGAITLFLSHVTKEGEYRGESGIAHDVDVAIEMKNEGENLVSIHCEWKNRFATTPRVATEQLYDR